MSIDEAIDQIHGVEAEESYVRRSWSVNRTVEACAVRVEIVVVVGRQVSDRPTCWFRRKTPPSVSGMVGRRGTEK